MKSLRRFPVFTLISCAIFTSSGYSQIAITSQDFQSNLNVVTRTLSYSSTDTTGLAAVLAASGPNKTWSLLGRSFVAATDTTISILMNKSGSGAPLGNNSPFSSATMVVRDRPSGKPWSSTWSYYSLTSTQLCYYGYVMDSAGIAKSSFSYSPLSCSQSYPTTYSSTWLSGSTGKVTSYGSTNFSIIFDVMSGGTVDAYGTIVTPEGSFPCLRIKRATALAFGSIISTTCTYEFVDRYRILARISADTSGKVPTSAAYYRQTPITDVPSVADQMPTKHQLLQNYPNPFNPTTTITFALPRECRVNIKIFNQLGQEVATVVSGEYSAGTHAVRWDARDMPSGVFICRLQAGAFVDARKLVLLR